MTRVDKKTKQKTAKQHNVACPLLLVITKTFWTPFHFVFILTISRSPSPDLTHFDFSFYFTVKINPLTLHESPSRITLQNTHHLTLSNTCVTDHSHGLG